MYIVYTIESFEENGQPKSTHGYGTRTEVESIKENIASYETFIELAEEDEDFFADLHVQLLNN